MRTFDTILNENKFKCQTLTALVNSYNELHHSDYRVQCDETMGWVEIIHDGTAFSGCLISDIAALASVYCWSYGIHTRVSNLTGKDTMYCLI